MAQDRSAFTSSEKACYTQRSLKRFDTLRNETGEILYYLRQMGYSLTSLPALLWNAELTESSGLGGEIILRLTPSRPLGKLVLSDFLSKRPRKRSLKSGRGFRGLK